MRNKTMPFWEKYMLTIEEASEYFHIGERKLRQFISENNDSNFLFNIGTKVLIKRKMFENFIDKIDCI